MRKIPQTGASIKLDPIIGWQADSSGTDHLSPTLVPPGLRVDCVTGQPAPFVPELSAQLSFPVALARRDRKLYVLDNGPHRVKSLDLELQNAFVTVTGFGGKGSEARQFRHPLGLALLADGSYLIADTGHNQVKIFSVYPNALLSVWGSGAPGTGAKEFNRPSKVVADPCGMIYIADRGNGRVQRIERDGSSYAPITGFKSPTGLSLAPDGTLAVLDSPDIYIYSRGQTTGTKLQEPVPSGSCLTFDQSGYLYAGTSTGLVYKYESDATASGGYRFVGIGVTGMDAKFLDLLWTPETELVGILRPRCSEVPVLKKIPVCGSYLPCGTLLTTTLDSGLDKCVWDRIELDASIPAGSLIRITTRTADTDVWQSSGPEKPQSFQPECLSYSSNPADCPISLTGENPDCLVQSQPGRYLRIRLEFKTNVLAAPTLRGVRINYPRSSYLGYLPAVYQDDDQSRVFLDRFLRIFQSTFDGLDQQIDNISALFDPLSVPEEWFYWLASWIALPTNPAWSDGQRRTALKSAGRLYPERGTAAGVAELVKQWCGIDVRVIEHFRLRQLIILSDGPKGGQVLGSGTRLWSRDHYRRLQIGVYSRVGYFGLTGEPEPDLEPLTWGANEFTVFFDSSPYQVAETRRKVEQAVEREKPAHTLANYAPVFPRMRVGVQCTLGVDTSIGECTPLLLGSTGILDYDSILACSKTENLLHTQRTTIDPRVETSTRLL